MNNNQDLLLAELDLLKSQPALQDHWIDAGLQQTLDIEYCFHDNLLEQGTLGLPDTTLLIRNGLISPARPMAESLAVLNHYQAIQYIREQAADQALLSENLLKQLHVILCRGISRDSVDDYRSQPVCIANTQHPAPAPEILPEVIQQTLYELQLEGSFTHPVLFAAESHLKILALQPFAGTANGVCARLVMNFILLQEAYPVTAIRGDSETINRYQQALTAALVDNDKSSWIRLMIEQVIASCESLLGKLEEIPVTQTSD